MMGYSFMNSEKMGIWLVDWEGRKEREDSRIKKQIWWDMSSIDSVWLE